MNGQDDIRRKRLTVRFHTSNIEKFLQARFVFQRACMTLGYFKESQDPYVEAYGSGKKQLLNRAVQEIVDRLEANSIFFVEDTSVRIEALSGSADFPGLQVKEWFQRTSFAKLNESLQSKGDDRRATVYSDIALFVPGLERPVYVSGATDGLVATAAPAFSTDVEHPWLTPNTFNGWFIPNGASRRLGEMPVVESLRYDFRVKALTKLVERLQEYAAVLNLPTGNYAFPLRQVTTEQTTLFPKSPLLVVVGRVCAGKTTFGNYTVSAKGGLHIEASDVMRDLAEASQVKASTMADKASTLLSKKGPDVVAKEIESRFGTSLDAGAVITGFRTLEEVWYIRERHPECRVILVECGDRIRFGRHLARQRVAGVDTFTDFSAFDRNQWAFGLLGRVADICDLKIINEGSMSEYERKITSILEGGYVNIDEEGRTRHRVGGVHVVNRNSVALRTTRLFRCLRALADLGRPASCREISGLTGISERQFQGRYVETVSDRHVNWILKDVPELARRIRTDGQPIQYEILPAGRTYVNMVGHNAWNPL